MNTLLLPRRKKAPQGRKPRRSDELIIALAACLRHIHRQTVPLLTPCF